MSKPKQTPATRKTIPGLVAQRAEFRNSSGTLRALRHPNREIVRRFVASNVLGDLSLTLQAHSELRRITYLVVSYQTPIAWEIATGYVFKVDPERLTQTSRKHAELLADFHGKEGSHEPRA